MNTFKKLFSKTAFKKKSYQIGLRASFQKKLFFVTKTSQPYFKSKNQFIYFFRKKKLFLKIVPNIP